MIDLAERQALLVLARQALEARVCGLAPPLPGVGGHDARWGAFVSIHAGRALRGCVGQLEPHVSLAAVIVQLGGSVADGDPRFEPVAPGELRALAIELSILEEPIRVVHLDEIRIGRDGLLAEQGRRRGVLLPQVAGAHAWDPVTFAGETCVKAGLPPSAWRQGAHLFRFAADVFSEEDAGATSGR